MSEIKEILLWERVLQVENGNQFDSIWSFPASFPASFVPVGNRPCSVTYEYYHGKIQNQVSEYYVNSTDEVNPRYKNKFIHNDPKIRIEVEMRESVVIERIYFKEELIAFMTVKEVE